MARIGTICAIRLYLASPGAAALLWGSRTHVLQRVPEYHIAPPGLTAKRPQSSSNFLAAAAGRVRPARGRAVLTHVYRCICGRFSFRRRRQNCGCDGRYVSETADAAHFRRHLMLARLPLPLFHALSVSEQGRKVPSPMQNRQNHDRPRFRPISHNEVRVTANGQKPNRHRGYFRTARTYSRIASQCSAGSEDCRFHPIGGRDVVGCNELPDRVNIFNCVGGQPITGRHASGDLPSSMAFFQNPDRFLVVE